MGMYLDAEEKKAVDSFLTQEGIHRKDLLVGIHPGSRKKLKAWFPDRFAALADSIIKEYGAQVIFTGSQEEKDFVNGIIMKMDYKAVNLAGKTNLRLLSGIIGKLDLFICNDSAPSSHRLCHEDTNSSYLRAFKEQGNRPYGNTHRVVEKDFPCRFGCDEDVCNHSVYKECMEK